jgi:membrane associated rhomboid family serine protease
MHRTHPVTWTLLLANILVFMLPTPASMMLWPTAGGAFMPWQVLTYGFVHASVPHLLLNLLALVSFGVTLERLYGPWRFLLLYLLCVIGAGVAQALWATQPTVGASGGIFGLFLAFAWQNPDKRVWVLIPPVGMRAKTLALLYAAASSVMIVTGWLPTVAHVAHLAGMAFGGLFCWAVCKPKA